MMLERVYAAYAIGLDRCLDAVRRQANNRYNYEYTTLSARQHTDGMSAVSECWVAELLGRAWLSQGRGRDKAEDGDVEGGVQVRWTPRVEGSLIVHPADLDWQPFVLVVGAQWPFRVAGWTFGAEAKAKRWWREDVRNPAYFVPQTRLDALATLTQAQAHQRITITAADIRWGMS